MVVSATADPYDYVTPSTADVLSMAPMSYYPTDSPAYAEFKKSLYSMNQALGNVNFNAQAYYDYYNLYKYNNAQYAAEFNSKLQNFEKAQDYLNQQYSDYQKELADFKNSLGYYPPTYPPTYSPTVNDNVALTDNLFNAV